MSDADQGGTPATPSVSDTDFAEPGGDAPLVSPPADSSRVGDREPGDGKLDDGADIGSTDAMASPTGGLAGTSR